MLKQGDFWEVREGARSWFDAMASLSWYDGGVHALISMQHQNEPARVMAFVPARGPWWLVGARPESGRIGRLRWFNSDQEEGVFGRVFWGRDAV
jgi:hypothetical protein